MRAMPTPPSPNASALKTKCKPNRSSEIDSPCSSWKMCQLMATNCIWVPMMEMNWPIQIRR